jgi:hypothetical protein
MNNVTIPTVPITEIQSGRGLSGPLVAPLVDELDSLIGLLEQALYPGQKAPIPQVRVTAEPAIPKRQWLLVEPALLRPVRAEVEAIPNEEGQPRGFVVRASAEGQNSIFYEYQPPPKRNLGEIRWTVMAGDTNAARLRIKRLSDGMILADHVFDVTAGSVVERKAQVTTVVRRARIEQGADERPEIAVKFEDGVTDKLQISLILLKPLPARQGADPTLPASLRVEALRLLDRQAAD